MSYIKAPFKIFSFAFKSITATIITLLFVGSLMLNISMMAWSAGAIAIGTAFTALTGITSVVTGMKDTNDILKDKNKKLAAKNAKLSSNKKAVGEITERIAKRTSRGALRNLSSIPTEAVPIAGIAVVVGVTTWELIDACETMKDMNELNDLIGNDVPVEEETVCGIEPPSSEEVYKTVVSSPGAAWNSMGQWEVNVPSWSEVGEGTKSVWGSTVRGAASGWKFILGNE